MRIGIVGSGVSGLTAAHLLHPEHEVVVFEADDRVGGHVHTVQVDEDHAVDTGFIVFNHETYPTFCRLLDRLDLLPGQPTRMSFSVSCERTGLEYEGSSLDHLFAQRRNLVRPSFLRMVRDLLRFYRDAERFLEEEPDSDVTLGDFLGRRRHGAWFVEKHLEPLISALWSAPPREALSFPFRFLAGFFHNHGMLRVRNRPQWYVVPGGSKAYVERLIPSFREAIRLNEPVLRVRREGEGVSLTSRSGTERFDEVVLACHADTALALVPEADEEERELLAAFPYQGNEVVLHTDESLLPRRRKCWASWNAKIPRDEGALPTLSYDMNILMGLPGERTFVVSLNQTPLIDPEAVIRVLRYDHPQFSLRSEAAQKRHSEMIRRRGLSYCGAYWGFGFHEDGAASGARVAEAFGARW